jgi:UDP-3-O-[3-hydroxymyristoyl] glucosamine N-acyltransferase
MDRFETVYVVLDGHGAGGPDYMDIFGSEADARSYMSGLVSSGYNENELWLTETTVKFTNNIDMTTFDFGDGKGPVAAHRHFNGGGWVADTATVAKTAYIGPDARVYGAARVYDYARMYGNAQVSGNAQVFGTARVYGTVWVFDDAQVSGNAQVTGDSAVSGTARVTE